jgi:hypothetical protein
LVPRCFRSKARMSVSIITSTQKGGAWFAVFVVERALKRCQRTHPAGGATKQPDGLSGQRAIPDGRSGAAFWGNQGEGGYSGKHGDVLLGKRQKRTLGDAVRSGDVVAVVGKRFARGKGRELADDAFAFDDDTLVLRIGDDPFAPLESDGFLRFVVDGDEVNEGIRALGGRVQMRSEDDAVHGDSDFGQFVDHGGGVGREGGLKVWADFGRGTSREAAGGRTGRGECAPNATETHRS